MYQFQNQRPPIGAESEGEPVLRPVTLLSVPLLAAAAPAIAQDGAAPSVFDGDYLTVGAGVAVGPSYDGSDRTTLFPVGAVQGRVGGIGIQPRPAGLAFDLVTDAPDARLGFILGPTFRVRLDRISRDGMKDDIVAALGKRDVGVEVGPTVGVTLNRVLHDYDSITLSSDFRWDIAGAHGGMVIAPSITYFTPLSRGAAVGLSLGAEHVDDDYADYYFSVTPAGSTASGLPVYAAGGGWKTISASLIGTIDLDGDLTNGGFALFGMANYSRLQGDAGRSPIVAIRGDADQWAAAIGVGYTF